MNNLKGTSWELQITSPKTGEVRDFKKYFSRKQGVVIVGDTTDRWNTLWKENPDGSFVQEPLTKTARWLYKFIQVDGEGFEGEVKLTKEIHCRFCSKALTHPNSQAVGYGPTCAQKYGLPWGEVDIKEEVNEG